MGADDPDHHDDIRVLYARVAPSLPTFAFHAPADTSVLGALRAELRRWCTAQPAPLACDVDDLVLAVSEAAANAIEHAYDTSAASASVEVRGTTRPDGGVEMTVRDRGRWNQEPPGAHGGRGIAIMRSIIGEVDVATDEHGTVVRLVQPARAEVA